MKNLVGVINKHDNDGDFLASFSVADHSITLLPLNEHTKEECRKLQYADLSSEKDSWLFGFVDNHSFAVLRRGVVPTSFSGMGIINFHTPILIRSERAFANSESAYRFDSIKFVGGIIDILYPPEIAISERNADGIKFKHSNDYTKKYYVNVDNEEFELQYSVELNTIHKIGCLPDFSSAHSSITLRFKSEKEFSKIEKYYEYILSLCQFCSGRLNVAFDIALGNSREHNTFEVNFVDGYDDYANDYLQITNVINLNNLGDRIIGLIKVLNESDNKPILLFLPHRNRDDAFISYVNVSDMCVAIDKEYRLLKIPFSVDKDKVKSISNNVVAFLKESGEDESIISRVQGLLGNLQNPSPKSMICQLYAEFYNSIDIITNNGLEDELRTIKRYSIEEFEKMAAMFVNIRNTSAHKGVSWNDGIKIYNHVKLLIYLSILRRAECTDEESIRMIDSMFYSQFL